jgi:trehalose/maltose transport system permease protein
MYMTFTLPLAVWLLTYLFHGIPGEVVESARVDGASHLRVYANVLMPMAIPALISVGLLVFILAWQEYLFAVTLTTFDPDLSTVPVAVTEYTRLGTPIGRVMASIVISSLPLVALTVLFQRRLVVGMTAGSVKT